MARIRSLKPEFFTSRSLARVSPLARLTFQGLWCQADDYGNGIAHADLLKGAVWPLDRDVTPELVEEHLQALADTGHITLYVVAGERYYGVVSWEQNQSAALRRGAAKFPSADDGVPAAREVVQDARETVLLYGGEGSREQGGELGLAPKNGAKNGARERDLVWEALMEVCGINGKPTDSARKAYNNAVKGLKAAGATPDEICKRADLYRIRWPGVSLTPNALERHWSEVEGLDQTGPEVSKDMATLAKVVADRESR